MECLTVKLALETFNLSAPETFETGYNDRRGGRASSLIYCKRYRHHPDVVQDR